MSRAATLKRAVAAAAVLLAAYAAAGFIAAPRLIARYLPAQLEARLGQPVAMGGVRVNPFTFSVRARDVRLGGRNGPAPIEVGTLLVDFDPLASGFGRGWVIGDLRVEDARVRAQ